MFRLLFQIFRGSFPFDGWCFFLLVFSLCSIIIMCIIAAESLARLHFRGTCFHQFIVFSDGKLLYTCIHINKTWKYSLKKTGWLFDLEYVSIRSILSGFFCFIFTVVRLICPCSVFCSHTSPPGLQNLMQRLLSLCHIVQLATTRLDSLIWLAWGGWSYD